MFPSKILSFFKIMSIVFFNTDPEKNAHAAVSTTQLSLSCSLLFWGLQAACTVTQRLVKVSAVHDVVADVRAKVKKHSHKQLSSGFFDKLPQSGEGPPRRNPQ